MTRRMPTAQLQLAIGNLLVMLGLTGCGWWNKTTTIQTTAPKPQETWTTSPLAVPPSPARPVRQGTAPLVYLVESAVTVRVTDETAGKELLRVPVAAGTIIAVNPRLGVQVGGATMKLGPLPASNQYSIYLENSTENYIQRGYVRPGQPGEPGIMVPTELPPAATQPGGVP